MRIALAFDVDGVLIRGKNVLPHASRTLQRLRKLNVPYIFLTNGGGTTEELKAKEWSQMGLDVTPNQVILSHSPMVDLVPRFRDQTILVLGRDSCRLAAHTYGFKKVVLPEELLSLRPTLWPFRKPFIDPPGNISLTEPISAVLSFHDSTDWSRDLSISLDLFRSKDGVLGTEGTDSEIGKYGKPETITYEFALRRLQHLAGPADDLKVFMVGDNPRSDIEGANRFGWDSILVQTGVYKSGPHNAKFLVKNVEDAVNLALQQ
ncbi:Haloacid dehalogenase-like hydrolase domain-containing 5 [Blyttiomyces sp. JEL0837]|nr:Haloacid dehalogenase-like hydrolase domain-containing 5 [Blyttiomyces sp. JEL0837]